MSGGVDAIKTLGLEINSEKAAKAVTDMTGDLRNLTAEGTRASDSVKALGSEANKQTTAIEQQAKAVRTAALSDKQYTELLESNRRTVAEANRQAVASANAQSAAQTAADKAVQAEARKTVAAEQERLRAIRDSQIEAGKARKQLADEARQKREAAEASRRYAEELEKEAAAQRRATEAAAARARTRGLAEINAHKLNDVGVDGSGNLLNTAKAATEADKAINKLRPSMVALASQATNTAGPIGTMAGTLATLAGGSALTLGIAAGIGAVGFAIDKLAEKAKAGRKETDEAIASLKKWYELKNQGSAGQFGAEVAKTAEDLKRQRAELESLRNILATPNSAASQIRVERPGGVDNTQLANRVAQAQKDYDRLLPIYRKGEQNVVRIQQDAAAEAYATLAKSNQLQAGERSKALLALGVYEKELSTLNKKAAAGFSIPEEDMARRRELVTQIESLKDALNPKVETKGLNAAVDHLASVRDEVERLKQSAEQFGKEASIDKRISTITDALDRMEKKFPSLSKKIGEYRTEAVRAGEALKASAVAAATTEIENQYNAQKQLFDAVRAGGSAYDELSAAQQAKQEIDRRELELGTSLSESLKQRIRDAKELDANTKVAKGTGDLQAQAEAIRAETDAMKSGASTRATYTADLLYEKQMKDALLITEPELRKQRIDAITQLHDESVARINLVESMKQQDDEMKRGERTVDRATNEANRLARALRGDLLSAIQDLTNGGVKSFDDFFAKIGDVSAKAIAATDRARDRMRENLEKAKSDKVNGVDLTRMENDLQRMNSMQRAAGWAQIGAGSFSGGYAVGAQSGSKTTGALGGALQGAATGASIASVVPGIGTAVGAVVGAVVGMVGGILGGAAKGKQAAAQMAQNQVQINAAFDALRATFSNDALGVSIAQVKAQFAELRKSTETAYSGKRNEGERNRILAESAKLEAQRIADIKAENAAMQQNFKSGNESLALRVAGLTEEANAIDRFTSIEAERLQNIKNGIDRAEANKRAVLQMQLAEKELAAQRMRDAEDTRRRTTSTAIDTQAFTDPRGAADRRAGEEANNRLWDAVQRGAKEGELAEIERYNRAAETNRLMLQAEQDRRSIASNMIEGIGFNDPRAAGRLSIIEDANNRLWDAIQSGATEAEQAAIRFRNAAALANYEAKLLEQDRRTSEGLVGTALGYMGAGRKGEDLTRLFTNRQALNDAETRGDTPFNIDLLKFTQRMGDIAVNFQRAVDDETKRLTDKANNEIAANDLIIASIQKDAAERSAQIDKQIETESRKFDQLIAAQQAAVQFAQQQVQVSEQLLGETKRSYDALYQKQQSFGLSDASSLSPADRFALAQQQFDEQFGLARGGDRNAAANFGTAFDNLLKEARTNFASGTGYTSVESRSKGALDSLTAQYGGLVDEATQRRDNAVRSLEVQQSMLVSLQEQKTAVIDALQQQKTAIQTEAQRSIEQLQDLNKGIREQLPIDIAARTAELMEIRDKSIGLDSFLPAFKAYLETGAAPENYGSPTKPVTVSAPTAPTPGEAAIQTAIGNLSTAMGAVASEFRTLISAINGAPTPQTEAVVSALNAVGTAVGKVETAIGDTGRLTRWSNEPLPVST